jgi:hypothetical protein
MRMWNGLIWHTTEITAFFKFMFHTTHGIPWLTERQISSQYGLFCTIYSSILVPVSPNQTLSRPKQNIWKRAFQAKTALPKMRSLSTCEQHENKFVGRCLRHSVSRVTFCFHSSVNDSSKQAKYIAFCYKVCAPTLAERATALLLQNHYVLKCSFSIRGVRLSIFRISQTNINGNQYEYQTVSVV